jgi:predicted permease
VRTLANLQAVDLGFTPERLLLFDVDPPRNRYHGAERPALFERIRERLATIPGIEEATLSGAPLTNGGRSLSSILPNDKEPKPPEAAWVNEVGYRFIEAMRIPIVAGRAFDQRDRPDTPPVAVVSQQFARTFFPDTANPIDRVFRNNDRVYRIVGVTLDTHFDNTRSPARPAFYKLVAQETDASSMTFELRTSMASGTIMRSVRDAVAAVDKDLPIFDVRTQVQQIDATMANERLFATLTAAFGVLALVLACIGIYGVMAHNVSRRTGEIGIRMALGARRLDVLVMILREASWLTMMGVALGAIASVWLARYLKAMLFGIEPADPATIAGAIGIMLAVALFAGWLPARRAARVDPMVALRNE